MIFVSDFGTSSLDVLPCIIMPVARHRCHKRARWREENIVICRKDEVLAKIINILVFQPASLETVKSVNEIATIVESAKKLLPLAPCQRRSHTKLAWSNPRLWRGHWSIQIAKTFHHGRRSGVFLCRSPRDHAYTCKQPRLDFGQRRECYSPYPQSQLAISWQSLEVTRLKYIK